MFCFGCFFFFYKFPNGVMNRCPHFEVCRIWKQGKYKLDCTFMKPAEICSRRSCFFPVGCVRRKGLPSPSWRWGGGAVPQGLLEKTSRVQLLSDPSLIRGRSFWFLRGFPGGSDIKESAMWETQVQSLGQEDPLEKGMATHSSTLAWKILWTEEPSRLWQSMVSQNQTRLSD